jgi:formylglycine-generating enzyme
MMRVEGAFCVDKWEASLVDKATGTPLSPYYPPDRRMAVHLAEQWQQDRLTMGDDAGQAVEVPELPAWQRDHDAEPMALSQQGVKPNGYLTQIMAARACENAGKRLCKPGEWRAACRGEAKRPFPYGETYAQGVCNIFRPAHPGIVLHGNPSIGHLDPRMNLVTDASGAPLLRVTGATPRCKSEWDGDAAWDMNGNIDEWVDASGVDLDTFDAPDAGAPDVGTPGASAPVASAAGARKAPLKGIFLGGFYSRSKRDGCASAVTNHQLTYLDYSTGARCCWSPDAPAAGGDR